MSEQERACRIASLPRRGTDRRGFGGRRSQRLGTGRPIDWSERRPALLKLTSGTTAAPRAIRFRSAQLLRRRRPDLRHDGHYRGRPEFRRDPVVAFLWFSNLVTPLLVRGVPMAISDDRMPRAVLDDLARTEATVFPGMPLFFQAFGEMSAGAAAAETAPVHFGRRAAEPQCGAEFSGEIRSADSFLLWGIGVWRHLLRPARRRNDARRFCRDADCKAWNCEPLDADADATQVRVRSAAVGRRLFPGTGTGQTRQRVFSCLTIW